jgi:hypothetical protein
MTVWTTAAWRLALACAAALLMHGGAAAQNIVCPTMPPGDSSNACASTAFVQQDLPGLPIADPRAFQSGLSCTGGVNASTGIANAIAAGYLRIRLPAGCYYQPPTSSGNEVVPAGVQIIGDNWDPNLGLFSQVQTANRATSTDALVLAKGASLQNVAVQSYFCDQSVNPQGAQKVCPIGYVSNIGDQTAAVTNWAYEAFLFLAGSSTTQPGGVVSTDTPLVGVTQPGGGDGIFVATTGAGVGARIQTQGNADQGVLIQDGFANPGNAHWGLQCAEYGTNSANDAGCLYLTRQNGSTWPLLYLSDVGPTTYTSSIFDWVVQYASGGNLLSIFQAATAFSGNFVNINAGNSGGGCSGNFLNLEVASAQRVSLSCAGVLTLYGSTSGSGTISVSPAGGTLQFNGGALAVASGGTGDTGTSWAAFTASPSCGTAAITTNSARFKTIGKTAWIQVDFTISSLGTCTSSLTFNAPVAVNTAGNGAFPYLNNATLALGYCKALASATTIACGPASGGNFAVNDRPILTAVYETQ